MCQLMDQPSFNAFDIKIARMDCTKQKSVTAGDFVFIAKHREKEDKI